jgi:ArsR family transcriptional regulator, arsenate/arsenite/antimonite-responsive transcriptional repressor / arsenate reductase (thioredoxin)
MPRAGDVVLDHVRSSADGACLADKLVSEAAASPAASWSWERRRTHVRDASISFDTLPEMFATATQAGTAPPPFLRLAGHPLRWRLLMELARSDRRVGELCELAGRRQSLVSYHLRQLRDGGLVLLRRSDADGRDTYYALDVARCGELLANAGASLHPGLTPQSHSADERNRRSRPVQILFLCTGNSARSQIAEALCERLSGAAVSAVSAGSNPKPLHRNAVRVMRKRAIDISGRSPKHLSEFAGQRFDYVISLCDRVREVCPEFRGAPEVIHWSIPDPAREPGSDEQTLPVFERIATELETRISFLIEAINATRQEGIQHA